MKDTITVKFVIEADFDTIQGLRQSLAQPQTQEPLKRHLANIARAKIQAETPKPFNLETELIVPQYRKTKRGPREPIPQVVKGVLTWYDPEVDQSHTIGPVGSPAWFAWLAEPDHRSFTYISTRQATFTALKNDKGYWIAHKQQSGKLKRKYLGKPKNLTRQKMDAIALELAERN